MNHYKAYGRRKGGKWSNAPKSARPTANRATRREIARENWAAQARYDEENGTDNGYDPRIRDMNEFHANEMGY